MKKVSSIEYGYKKLGVIPQVLSTTLLNGNSKNDQDKETEEEGKLKRVNI